jgi:hypothetical protein
MDQQPADDVERLLARLASVDPPADFVQNVMSRTRGLAAAPTPERAAWARWVYAGVYVLSMLSLLLLAYGLGLTVAHNGTSNLVSALAADAGLFADAPQSYLLAIVTSLPWLQIAAVAIDLALVGLVTQMILRGAGQAVLTQRSEA